MREPPYRYWVVHIIDITIICLEIFLHHIVVGLLQLVFLINLLFRDDLVKFGIALRADWA